MSRWIHAIACAGVLMLGVSAASAEPVCALKSMKAMGRPALLVSAARSKARSAWMRKVAANRRLGKSYASWLRASEPAYNCRKAGKRFVCEAKARPCKN